MILLEIAFKKEKVKLAAEYKGNAVDPFKRGLGGNYSKDHLEVFIEGNILIR